MNNGKTVKSGLNTAFTCDKLSRHIARMQNLGGGGAALFFLGGGQFRRKPKMLTLIQKTPGTQGLFIFLVIFCNKYL